MQSSVGKHEPIKLLSMTLVVAQSCAGNILGLRCEGHGNNFTIQGKVATSGSFDLRQ
jgi:hypothetical protein